MRFVQCTKSLEEVEGLSKWRGVPGSWLSRLKIVKMSIKTPPNGSINSAESLSKSQLAFHAEIGKLIVKFIWKCKRSRNAKKQKAKKTKTKQNIW